MPMIIEELQAEVLLAAPTEQEEENLVLYGQEGEGAITTKYSYRSSDDERESFVREPGMYLRQAILQPGVFAITTSGSQINIAAGNTQLLNNLTHFSWINASKAGTFHHTSNYGLFSIFEWGSVSMGFGRVKPVYGQKLVPLPGARLSSMDKIIPPFNMFEKIDKARFRAKIISRIRMALHN